MADHLTTALVLRREGIAWTSLRQKKGGVEVAGQCVAALEIPPAATDLSDPEAAAQVKARCAGVKGRLTLALPTAQALLRAADDYRPIEGTLLLRH